MEAHGPTTHTRVAIRCASSPHKRRRPSWPAEVLRDQGQTATEYAVVLGVIVVGIGAPALALRDTIGNFITKLGAALVGLL